jgi:hypothetical protein
MRLVSVHKLAIFLSIAINWNILSVSCQENGLPVAQSNQPILPQNGNLLVNILPQLIASGANGNNLPLVGTLSQTIPFMREAPLLGAIVRQGGAGLMPQNPHLDEAIEKFVEPFLHMSTGGEAVQSDVNQIIRSVPNLIVNLPGFGNINIDKIRPRTIEYVLNGGQFPGVTKEKLDAIVRQYMKRMHAVAAKHLGRPYDPSLVPDPMRADRYLRPMSQLPDSIIQKVLQGEPLPHLTLDETETVKEYYLKQTLPMGEIGELNVTEFLSPKVIKMMKLLPPGYNISQLPAEVKRSVLKGDFPDLSHLPSDLQLYIKDNIDEMFNTFSSATDDVNINEIISKLPMYKRLNESTFVPYTTDNDEDDTPLFPSFRTALLIALLMGIFGLFTLLTVAFFCLRLKRAYDKRELSFIEIQRSSHPESRNISSVIEVPVPHGFNPSITSTLKKSRNGTDMRSSATASSSEATTSDPPSGSDDSNMQTRF